MPSTSLNVQAVIDLIQPDPALLAAGERRMDAIWRGEAADSLPILFSTPVSDVPSSSDIQRRFLCDEQMLYDWAVGLVGAARSGSDIPLTIRADTGTGTLATVAGCQLLPSEHSLPWTTHITRAEIEAFDVAAQIADAGIMPRVRNLYTYFRENVPACVHCFCADTQGPFDIAHLLYGNELFYAIYDEPEFVHNLLEKTTALYIAGTALMKSWIDEPRDGGYHWGVKLANGGVRVCEDTPTLLAPDAIAEFVLPYEQRALEAFGGGYVHFCGDNAALYQGVLRNPAVRGMNFGNPERYDFATVIPELIAAGKCYFGTIPRRENEALAAYFSRIIAYTGHTRKGLILQPALTADEVANPTMVVDLWRSLQ